MHVGDIAMDTIMQCSFFLFTLIMLSSLYPGEPEVFGQLIIALGLGSSGHHITPVDPQPIITKTTSTLSRFTRSSCDDAQQVCHHVTTPCGRFKST